MKKTINLIAPAKLNLNLFVTQKLKNNYHFLKSDICFLNLCDEILMKKSEHNKIEINPNSYFALKRDTLLFKTLELFNSKFRTNNKFKIILTKNIPIGAGLGGGSSDSAALLLGLRYFYNKSSKNRVTINDLKKIGFQIGSDVPACITSSSLQLNSVGNKFKKIRIPQNYKFLIIYPNKKLSTKSVFEKFDLKNIEKKSCQYFNQFTIFNSLKCTAEKIEPEIKEICNTLKSFEKIIAYGMSGTGSACFGIFKNTKDFLTDKEFKNITSKKNYFIWHGNKKEFGYNRILY